MCPMKSHSFRDEIIAETIPKPPKHLLLSTMWWSLLVSLII